MTRAIIEVVNGQVVIMAIGDSDGEVERVEREVREAFRREIEQDGSN